jgi:hypothetical protein
MSSEYCRSNVNNISTSLRNFYPYFFGKDKNIRNLEIKYLINSVKRKNKTYFYSMVISVKPESFQIKHHV